MLARVLSVSLDGKRVRNARSAHTFINFACLTALLAAVSLTTCRRGTEREERIKRRRKTVDISSTKYRKKDQELSKYKLIKHRYVIVYVCLLYYGRHMEKVWTETVKT